MWPLLTVWAAAGVVMTRHRPAAAIAAIMAAQVATNGLFAVRYFFATFGLGGIAKHDLVTMVTYAVAVVVAAVVSIVIVVALQWREPVGWRGLIPSGGPLGVAFAYDVSFTVGGLKWLRGHSPNRRRGT